MMGGALLVGKGARPEREFTLTGTLLPDPRGGRAVRILVNRNDRIVGDDGERLFRLRDIPISGDRSGW